MLLFGDAFLTLNCCATSCSIIIIRWSIVEECFVCMYGCIGSIYWITMWEVIEMPLFRITQTIKIDLTGAVKRPAGAMWDLPHSKICFSDAFSSFHHVSSEMDQMLSEHNWLTRRFHVLQNRTCVWFLLQVVRLCNFSLSKSFSKAFFCVDSFPSMLQQMFEFSVV